MKITCAVRKSFVLTLVLISVCLSAIAQDDEKAVRIILSEALFFPQVEQKNDTPAAVESRVKSGIDSVTDYRAISDAVLSSVIEEIKNITPAERLRFDSLLRELFRKRVSDVVLKQKVHRVKNGDIERSADGSLFFEGTAYGDGSDKAEVKFKMTKRDAAWKLTDMIVEDVSTVSSYRSQFTKIIRTEGFQVLLQKIQAKLQSP